MLKSEIQTILEDFETWPAHKQLAVYQVLKWLQDEEEDGGRAMTPEEEAEIDEALSEADRKEFVSDEEMDALFEKFR